MTRFLLAWGPAALWAAVLFLLSELPSDVGGVGLPINDKVIHVGLYTVLGGTLAWAGFRTGWGGMLLFTLVGVSYGALDEWHQAFVPGRDPSLGDLAADAVGVIAGFLLLRFVLKARTPGSAGQTQQEL